MAESKEQYHVLLRKPWLIGALISLFYLVTHVFNLTNLPIFADEAIYLRWTQLMIDDFSRYALFPLNDGKTPLQMWFMIPFQFLFSDQLYAGRFLSVLAGIGQIWATGWVVKLLGGRQKTVWLAMILTAVLPFWFFHHRVALIDGLLTLWLTLALGSIIKLAQLSPPTKLTLSVIVKNLLKRKTFLWIVAAGVSLGLAMLTKMTALLFMPALALYCFLPSGLTLTQRFQLALQIGISCFLGLAIFALLKLHPAFGQLFSRGSDFLYPAQTVFLEGLWQTTIKNFPTYVEYFVSYLTLPLLLLATAGLFSRCRQRTYHVLFWSALLFCAPIALLGKVVYPRYYLPAAIPLTVSSVLVIQELIERWIHQPRQIWRKALLTLLIFMLLANTLASSFNFMVLALTNPNATPFVSADRTQYLTEWSSGHGITETVEFITAEAAKQPTAVATEGFFGTLPDALNVYLHRRNVNNLYVEGVGQPVSSLPSTFIDRAKDYQKVYLVVNSHRMQMSLPSEKLVEQYCRPNKAPCLQIWDITDTHQR